MSSATDDFCEWCGCVGGLHGLGHCVPSPLSSALDSGDRICLNLILERGQLRTLTFALAVYRQERRDARRRCADWPEEERELDRLAVTLALANPNRNVP